MLLLFYFGIGVTLFSALGLIALFALSSKERMVSARVASIAIYGQRPRNQRGDIEGWLVSLARTCRARIGMAETPKLRARFVAAGIKNEQSIEVYFGAQMLFPVLGIIIGSFIPSNTLFWIMVFVVIGYMLPDFVLDRKVKSRRESIRRSIPDAIDLLVICVDAGLGIDQAMLRVGQELAVSHPQINEEFLQINREQRAGKPRLDAWQSFAERSQLPDIAGFVNMLVQTERFGTPIARALSTFADGMRLKRRQIAEEKAAKTTVKIMFPLVLFIFPCMFIVLLGPAVISMMRNMSQMIK
jgi:tight adherence protein C